MTHPDHNLHGFTERLLEEADKAYPNQTKELYSCTKIRTNIGPRFYVRVKAHICAGVHLSNQSKNKDL